MATSKGKQAVKAAHKKAGPAKKKAVPAKKKPAPAKKKPVPAKKKPAPAKKKSAPARKKPAPATKKPAPAKKKSAPATKKPAPATKKPAPAKKKPAPAKKAAPTRPSKPAVTAPAPSAPETSAKAEAAKEAQAKRLPPKKPEPKVHRPKAKMGPDGVLVLEDDKILNKAFYAGQQMPSPMGGFLQLLVVRSKDDGSAVAHMECSASSLRYVMELAKATKTERAHVREIQEKGEDPDCPRHGGGVRLLRAGKDLVCPLCGVTYGRV